MRTPLVATPYRDQRPGIRVPATLVMLLLASAPTAAAVRHDLRVSVHPDQGTLQAEDTLTLPVGAATADFLLHAGLAAKPATAGATLEVVGRVAGAVPLERYRLRLPAGASQVTLRYGGTIRHPVTDATTDGGRPMPTTPGLIDPDGVYLDGASGWYPELAGETVTFSLTVSLPPAWHSVSQGTPATVDGPGGAAATRWEEHQPQDGIYLVAAPFTVYRQATPVAEAMVYLRRPDPELARRYLDATGRYLALYAGLIGPYPYGKFALVENAWETGYGMPSFTLIGSRVIRLPFILESSYPHEILHNWWGNGVWIDYGSGNWAEGLTSYLADHLIQEQRGAGAEYRRSALQKYADYVAEAEDFPLEAFRGRHGEVSQAVGYNKALMVFHMLRRELGDATFVDGLRRLYRENRFRAAGWADLRRAFEAASGRDLGWLFSQWVERSGAPVLRLSGVTSEPTTTGHRVTGQIAQLQPGPPYRLRIPLAVQAQGETDAVEAEITLEGPAARFTVETTGRPLRLQVDPRFDLFRRLDPAELPASFGRLFGAPTTLVVLPSRASEPLREAYRALALDWGRGPAAVATDAELKELPADRPVWVLGWENRFRPLVAEALIRQADELTDAGTTLAGTARPRAGHVVTVAVPRRGIPGSTLGWIGGDEPAAIAGVGRKLRHYGRYSYVVFDTPDLRAVGQGQWPVLDSPLGALLDPAGASAAPRLRPRPALAGFAGAAP